MTKLTSSASALRGYIEGYYGRLFTWEERAYILSEMASLSMDLYFYAPKEDPFHRFQWRVPYPADWLSHFSSFASQARANNLLLATGIAPGLDYNWKDDAADFAVLLLKSETLVSAGAHIIVLLLDDIPETADLAVDSGRQEGAAHGALAKRLAEQLAPKGASVMCVPRLYADEMADLLAFDTGQPLSGEACAFIDAYAGSLTASLPEDMPVIICGEHVIAHKIQRAGKEGRVASHISQPLIIWDNLYCHDYCPRRLFVGPYEGRQEADAILLNGTGLPETDRLLLQIMIAGHNESNWRDIISKAGVPDEFFTVAPFFDKPMFSDTGAQEKYLITDHHIAHVDRLLWHWKSPLQREWYPYLFGLKQDMMIACQKMNPLRIAKTQTAPLTACLNQTKR